MAWYWPEVNTPESAKVARRKAVWVSFLLALISLTAAQPALESLIYLSTAKPAEFLHHPWEWRLLLGSVMTAVLFSVIGWGIHGMSRTASIIGLVLCFYSTANSILVLHTFGSVGREIFWIVLGTLLLTCYVAAVRATFAYHRHNLAATQATN
jgi:hypothetical protein